MRVFTHLSYLSFRCRNSGAPPFWLDHGNFRLTFVVSDQSPVTHELAAIEGWSAPPYDLLKINCDAAYCPRTIVASSASQAEAHAVRMACLFAQTCSLLHVIIESDNRQVIQLSASKNVPLWELNAVIRNVKSLASQLQLSFSRTRRGNNKVAHWVAKSLASKSLPPLWNVYPPVSFSFLVATNVSSFGS
ncbi:hypothetical protein ACSBR1_012987 [Camellia fascicularis]